MGNDEHKAGAIVTGMAQVAAGYLAEGRGAAARRVMEAAAQIIVGDSETAARLYDVIVKHHQGGAA